MSKIQQKFTEGTKEYGGWGSWWGRTMGKGQKNVEDEVAVEYQFGEA